jgi:hypothetical protein
MSEIPLGEGDKRCLALAALGAGRGVKPKPVVPPIEIKQRPSQAAAAAPGRRSRPKIVLGKASPRDQAFTGSATRCGELLLLDECSVFDDESFSLLVDEDESFQSPRRLARSSHA